VSYSQGIVKGQKIHPSLGHLIMQIIIVDEFFPCHALGQTSLVEVIFHTIYKNIQHLMSFYLESILQKQQTRDKRKPNLSF
jgi:hypothetical protein